MRAKACGPGRSRLRGARLPADDPHQILEALCDLALEVLVVQSRLHDRVAIFPEFLGQGENDRKGFAVYRHAGQKGLHLREDGRVPEGIVLLLV